MYYFKLGVLKGYTKHANVITMQIGNALNHKDEESFTCETLFSPDGFESSSDCWLDFEPVAWDCPEERLAPSEDEEGGGISDSLALKHSAVYSVWILVALEETRNYNLTDGNQSHTGNMLH